MANHETHQSNKPDCDVEKHSGRRQLQIALVLQPKKPHKTKLSSNQNQFKGDFDLFLKPKDSNKSFNLWKQRKAEGQIGNKSYELEAQLLNEQKISTGRSAKNMEVYCFNMETNIGASLNFNYSEKIYQLQILSMFQNI